MTLASDGSLLDAIGATPVVRLRRVPPAGVDLRLKLENLNPAGSAKDRLGAVLIAKAEQDGTLKPGAQVVEATTGNLGIALALACAPRGYRFTAVMPEDMTLERRATLKALGARVVLTPAEGGFAVALAKAQELAQATGAFWPNAAQAEPEAGRAIGRELIETARADGVTPAAIFVGVGTGETLVGLASAVGEVFPHTRIVGVGPSAPRHRLQGLGLGLPNVPPVVPVCDREAWAVTQRLAREEGLLVGISTGAVVVAALASGLGGPLYAIAMDTGERYFSLGALFS